MTSSPSRFQWPISAPPWPMRWPRGRKLSGGDATVHASRHTPPPGLAFGEPDDRLQRSIQYAAALRPNHGRSGILDHPLEPVIGRRDAPTRWRVTTFVAV